LLLAGVAVGVTSGAASAAPGTATTTNACINNATVTYGDLDWTLKGTAGPNPATLGAGSVTLAGASVVVNIPSAVLIAGYNTGVLVVGSNPIPTTIWVARQATNVDIGGGIRGTSTRVDSFSVSLTTVITDPTPGVPGDETATPLAVDQPLPDWTVTPMGGDVAFSQAPAGALGSLPIGVGGALVPVKGSIFSQSNVGLKVNFDCSPGVTIPTTGVAGTSGTTFTPAATVTPFETASVVAPPTAPVCTNVSVSVGVGQSGNVDLSLACTDVNQSQGGGSPFTYTLGAVSAGTLVAGPTANVFVYTAPAVDPGSPVVVSFTATDTTNLTSAPASITITVLANKCDATNVSCNLTQILVQPVVGTTMTMEKVPGLVVMSPVLLDGKPQVSSGAINTITVTNARGSAAGWSVTAYVTDIGTAAATTFTPLPGVTVPLCSNAGAGPLIANPLVAASVVPDRNCIPGDNLGWTPAAAIGHGLIPGDVAQVAAGPASATGVAPQTDAQAWLAALIAAGRAKDPGVGVDGLGGLLSSKTLCSAPVNHSGGTFTCNAALYLGVPASAGAGNYSGGLVITLA
jgi:hypothetical protein